MSDRKYRVLILGDFHYGESYLRAGARILNKHGYSHSTQHLRKFIDSCDTFIINLETPLATESDFPSPLRGKKTYIHWADPVGAGNALADIGVSAVSLANNHSADLGPDALLATLDELNTRGIGWFGAGRTRTEAERPYSVRIPESVGGGYINLYGAFQYSRSHDENFKFYATDTSPGCARVTDNEPTPSLDASPGTDTFHVHFPHWGSNYAWRSPRQQRIARHLINSGFDFVVGHGSHALQEIHRESDRWVIYSIGNGNFQSGGRWKRLGASNKILPYSFWSVLEVILLANERIASIKLYPVYSDNTETRYQPRPVNEIHFRQVVFELARRAEPRDSFPLEHVQLGHDDLGHFIQLDVAMWPVSGSPLPVGAVASPPIDAHRPALIEVAESALDVPEHGPDAQPNTFTDAAAKEIIDQHAKRGRNLGALAISRAAKEDGATIKWLTKRDLWAVFSDRRVPLVDHMGTETSLASAIVGDKVLAKRLMSEARVSVPRGRRVRSAEDAVQAQEEIGRPVVVKPRFGSMGRGVTVNVSDHDDVRKAYHRARTVGDVIVEEFVHGQEYRAHATATHCVAVFRRLLPSVTGDGKSTVHELVEARNELRKLNPTTSNNPIPMDDIAEAFLARQGLGWDSTIPDGQRLVVRDVNGITSGGDSEECFDTVGTALKETAVAAVASIPGMDWGGVDILLEAGTGQPYVMEVNTDAAINGSVFPVYGRPRQVGRTLWDQIYAHSAPEPAGDSEPIISGARAETISSAVPGLEGAIVTFAEVFQQYLRNSGKQVTIHSPRAWCITDPSGNRVWFSHVQSASDSAIATYPLRRRLAQRRVLRQLNVPRTVGRQVASVGELMAFREELDSAVALLPLRGQRDIASNVIAPNEPIDTALFHDESKFFAQAFPSGPRFRIIATPLRVLAVVVPAGQTERDSSVLQRASKIAIDAVRAFPQLRWALVEIVARKGRRGRVAPLVENVSTRHSFRRDDVVVAGSLDEVFSLLASESVGDSANLDAGRRT